MTVAEGESFSFGFMKSDRFILGATFMRNMEISFDMGNGKSSFARCNCGGDKNFKEIY